MELLLKGMDDEVMRRVKAGAALRGVTLKEYVIGALLSALGAAEAESKTRAAAKVEEAKLEAVDSPVIVSAPEKVRACDTCGAPCVRWGPKQRHCTKCSRNHPL